MMLKAHLFIFFHQTSQPQKFASVFVLISEKWASRLALTAMETFSPRDRLKSWPSYRIAQCCGTVRILPLSSQTLVRGYKLEG
jgi:hypothetical protein